jgi:hypothetical protein
LSERPERQIHIGRRVVRKPAQHQAPLVVGGEVPQEPAGEGVGQEAGGKGWRNAGQEVPWAVEQQLLDRGKTSCGALGHVAHRAELRLHTRRPGTCHLRTHERLGDAERDASPYEHRENGAQHGPPGCRHGRELGICSETPEDGSGPRLHVSRYQIQDPPSQRAAQRRCYVGEYAPARFDKEGRTGVRVARRTPGEPDQR